MRATKNFRQSDWLKRWSIKFDSEIGGYVNLVKCEIRF